MLPKNIERVEGTEEMAENMLQKMGPSEYSEIDTASIIEEHQEKEKPIHYFDSEIYHPRVAVPLSGKLTESQFEIPTKLIRGAAKMISE